MSSPSWQSRLLSPALKHLLKPVLFPRKPTVGKLELGAALSRQLERLSPYPRQLQLDHVKLSHCQAEWISPLKHTSRVVLYLHGGGYNVLSPRLYRDFNTRLGTAAQAHVLAVDYRQGARHPWPAALDDALEAYHYLLAQGYESAQIVVAGDSAGGHLTLSLLLALRDRGLGQPAGAIPLSPWTNLAGDFPSMEENRHSDVVLHTDAIRAMGRFHARGRDLRDPAISPAFANYQGLAPLYIIASSSEILRDDARAVRDAARQAGVRVRYEEMADLPHAYTSMTGLLPEARATVDDMARFIQELIPAA